MPTDEKHALYPPVKSQPMRLNAVRKWAFRAMLSAFLICAVINLSIGGKPWVLLLALAEYIFYSAFLSKALIESSLLERFVSIMFSGSILLLLTSLWGSGSAEVALPLTCFGMLCLSCVISLLEYKNHRKNLLPIIIVFATSVAVALIGLFMPWGMNWPSIVLLSTSVVLIILALLLFRETISIELRKRFSVK